MKINRNWLVLAVGMALSFMARAYGQPAASPAPSPAAAIGETAPKAEVKVERKQTHRVGKHQGKKGQGQVSSKTPVQTEKPVATPPTKEEESKKQ